MRKLVASEFVTLDGVVEEPQKWSLSYWNDEIAKFKLEELSSSDALLLGRVTYQGFAAAWPKMGKAEGVYADMMNGYSKFVASTTLKELEWNNSRLLKGNVAEEVARLKRQPGKDILIFGSGTLIHSLAPHDLIDEYRLLVYPVVLGTGRRLLAEGENRRTLRLIEARPIKTGAVLLRYEPIRKDVKKTD